MDATNEKDVNEIEVVDAVLENGTERSFDASKCVPGELCKVGDFFEMINVCELCGKIL